MTNCSKRADSNGRSGSKFGGGTLGAPGKESGRACRICLDESETEENPFITPCKCAGSMKFIHLICLQEW